MKSRWLKTFEQEQKEKEEAERAAKLASAHQASLEEERNAAALPDGPSAADTGENGVHAESVGTEIKPPQTADLAQSNKPQPLLPPGPQPTALSASNPAEAERRELALAAEANALAELADSASEGERGLGSSGLADVVVDSPPARRAPGEVSS